MREYETVGVLDADVAAMLASGDDTETIAVEHDDPAERWVARPKGGESE